MWRRDIRLAVDDPGGVANSLTEHSYRQSAHAQAWGSDLVFRMDEGEEAAFTISVAQMVGT